MSTANGFHSMSEERRIVFQLRERSDGALTVLLDHVNPSVRATAARILRERAAQTNDMHAGEA